MRAPSALLALLIASPLLAQPAPVTVSLAPNDPTVGDHVQATITVRARASDLSGEPRFPVWGKTWGEAEIIESGQPARVKEQDGFALYEQRLVLAAFRTGSVPLPPAEISIPTKAGMAKVGTPPTGLAIAVRSVIPQNEKNPQPKPPESLRPLPLGDRFWWTVAILSAACLGGTWLLWCQRRAAATAVAAPILPPFEELTAELDRLGAEPSMIALHTRLSLALRRYLGRRLPFPAVESTTSEVQRQLLSRRMPGPLVRQTVELLRACDLVKFARQEVAEARARERSEAALRIAREFESQLAPREPEALEKAG